MASDTSLFSLLAPTQHLAPRSVTYYTEILPWFPTSLQGQVVIVGSWDEGKTFFPKSMLIDRLHYRTLLYF